MLSSAKDDGRVAWDRQHDRPGWLNGQILLGGRFTLDELRAIVALSAGGAAPVPYDPLG
ncbi:hypothetical protein [Burkholderia singularis]|nr:MULTISPECIES: hypothetical protein [Burkholderia]